MVTQRAHAIGFALCAAVTSIALAVPAAAFPPPKAAPHTAVYKMTSKLVRDGKTETKKDTVTISVLGSRSSWKDGDGEVTIYDAQKKTMTVYGGKSKEKVAFQKPLPDTSSTWELGWQTLAANSSVPPKEGAKAKYGGESCTVYQFETRSFGKPELCVTDKGIVARYADHGADGSETIYEAEKINSSAPSRDAFEIPAGFQLKD
jgi:hypothetical protein